VKERRGLFRIYKALWSGDFSSSKPGQISRGRRKCAVRLELQLHEMRDLRIVYAKSDGLRSSWDTVSSRERGSSAREDDEEPKRSGMRESGADAER